MLTYYITQTQRLLQNPAAPTSLYSQSDLISYINTMRGQLAADARCIKTIGTVIATPGVGNYLFSGIGIGLSGTAGVLHVNQIRYAVGSGAKLVYPRPWPWFVLYALNNPVPDSGPPSIWSQFQQGAAGVGSETNVGAGTLNSGAFNIYPLPDIPYNLRMEVICYPNALASDTDAEAIPYEWTDAVPFGAAWMALLSAQTSTRMSEAQQYFQIYQQYVARARNAANPDVLKWQYEQQPNITLPNQLGIGLPKGGGQ